MILSEGVNLSISLFEESILEICRYLVTIEIGVKHLSTTLPYSPVKSDER